MRPRPPPDYPEQPPVCTCQPIVRRGRRPEPAVDPECPVHGWQNAGMAGRLGAGRANEGDERSRLRLLTERSVMAKLDWPSRRYIDLRIKADGFPGPHCRLPGLGDQWLESEVDAWILSRRGLGLQVAQQQPAEKAKG